ncbi:type I methionyl aminopeptidase [Candidatus Roizmanbacteria bacterium]|nr:type I methionyl aminopeptidase [Candidatus Roizmanbacteria bacterium]
MIKLKTQEEIAIMQEAGRRLRKVMMQLLPQIKPGVTTQLIDKKAEELIIKLGGQPSFKRVKNYSWATCLPINEQIVHTPPSMRKLKNGDILTIDIGFYLGGFHTDHALTIIVGDKEDPKVVKFLNTGKKTLEKALAKVKTGNYLGEVSKTIEEEIEKAGYHVVQELTGHGIGHDLHEDPLVPGLLEGSLDKTYKIKPGLVIAVEVIYAMGTSRMKFEKGSEWSIVTVDGSLSACFEHTIAITKEGSIVLT